MCIVYAQCNRACYRFAQWFVMLSLPTPLICDPCTSTSARLDPCAALDWTNLPISISPLVASRSKPLVSIGNLSNHVESVCTEVCLKFTPSQLYDALCMCQWEIVFNGFWWLVLIGCPGTSSHEEPGLASLRWSPFPCKAFNVRCEKQMRGTRWEQEFVVCGCLWHMNVSCRFVAMKGWRALQGCK